MIDNRNLNYSETLQQISQLKESIENIHGNIEQQVPYVLFEKFKYSQLIFLNWLEEIEFILDEYNNKK